MNLRGIYKLFKPYMSAIYSILIFSILVSLISVAAPFVNRFMIDQGLLSGNIHVVFIHATIRYNISRQSRKYL